MQVIYKIRKTTNVLTSALQFCEERIVFVQLLVLVISKTS